MVKALTTDLGMPYSRFPYLLPLFLGHFPIILSHLLYPTIFFYAFMSSRPTRMLTTSSSCILFVLLFYSRIPIPTSLRT